MFPLLLLYQDRPTLLISAGVTSLPTQQISPPTHTLRKSDEGILHAHRLVNPTKVDKTITLKKNNNRPHIHRYTVRFKTIKSKSEDEAHQLIQDCLQRFLDIVLQADPKTTIPPYLELDRNDKSVSDISSVFPVTALESYHAIKKYFSAYRLGMKRA
jgi:hypothetical protein